MTRRLVSHPPLLALGFACACAAGSSESCPPICPPDGSVDSAIDLPADTTIVDTNATFQSCATGQAVTGRITSGPLCASIATAIGQYVEEHCFLYFGWSDSCDACTGPPAKWGRTNQAICDNNGQSNSTCSTSSLGAQNVQLLGINPDGDVNDDDKFFFGWQCEPPPPSTIAQDTCPTGMFVIGNGPAGVLHCGSIGLIAQAILNTECSFFAGWSDSCGGCTNAPAKWGRFGAGFCENGAGTDNTCSTHTLGSASVQLLGINTDGTVDDNDQFYLGFECADVPSEGDVAVIGDCPGDRIATGLGSDGSILCSGQSSAVTRNMNVLCSTYFGWVDDCDGCTDTPSRWGRTNGDMSCASGAGGTANVCITPALGAYMPPLFGLGTDGTVDDNDKLYVGLRCL